MAEVEQTEQNISMRELSGTYSQLLTLQEEIITLIKQEEERLERLNKEDFHKINTTINKIPIYQEKLNNIVKMMAVIDKQARKLKRRTAHIQDRH